MEGRKEKGREKGEREREREEMKRQDDGHEENLRKIKTG